MIKKPTKTHRICFHLFHINAVPTRVNILHRVWVNEPGEIPFKERSNHCYFTRYGRGNGGEYSLVTRGFIRITGKTRTGRLLYALTAKGMRCAKAYETWLLAQDVE